MEMSEQFEEKIHVQMDIHHLMIFHECSMYMNMNKYDNKISLILKNNKQMK